MDTIQSLWEVYPFKKKMCFIEDTGLLIVSVIMPPPKKVMIMFSIVRDIGARTTRNTINHSVERGWRQGCRGGCLEGGRCREQWQFGKVIWAELLACGESPHPRLITFPHIHHFHSVGTSLFFFSLSPSSLVAVLFSSALSRHCVHPRCEPHRSEYHSHDRVLGRTCLVETVSIEF